MEIKQRAAEVYGETHTLPAAKQLPLKDCVG